MKAGTRPARRMQKERICCTSLIVFLVLVAILIPAAPATDAVTGTQGVLETNPAEPDALVLNPQPSATSVTVRPTIITVRPTRTPALAAARTAADRLKDAVPPLLFIVILGIAFAGLIAILYMLVCRGSGSPVLQKKQNAAGTATIIENPMPDAGESPHVPAVQGPAVVFPPSLEKRYLNPVFIGEGGLARVFRAVNAKTKNTVAIKIPVRFDEITGTHFTRDIVFWQGLDHPNIIRIYTSNILPVPYIEMEYAPSSLATRPLPLQEDEAIRIVLGIARGIAYAHMKGIVHRDIKPENILLAADGTPKLTDWGLGKAIADPRQSTMLGFSPSYAAPEQIAPHLFGRPGPATDIYQLGMLLYEMLTGMVAFSGEGLHDLNMAILKEDPVVPGWNGTYEGQLKKIILKCLAKRPEERYPSVDELIRDLVAIHGDG